MEGEQLTASAWYKQLHSKHRPLLVQAAREGLVVCVPQTASLVNWRVRQDALSHHILRPTGVRGEFVSLSGRGVSISGASVVAGAGFPVRVTATMLSHDRLPFTLLPGEEAGDAPPPPPPPTSSPGRPPPPPGISYFFLSRPLEGGLAAAPSTAELDHGSVLRIIGVLRSDPASEPVFAGLEEALRLAEGELQDRETGVGAPLPPIAELLREECSSAADALLLEPSLSSTMSRRTILQVLESWAMERLSAPLMDALSDFLSDRTSSLARVLTSMAGCSQDEVGIKPLFQGSFAPAIALLGLLPSAATPLEKLQVLRDVCTTAQGCIERRLEERGVDLGDVDFATDDVLDTMLWLCVAGHPDCGSSQLPVHLAYIGAFHFAPGGDLEVSRLGFILASWEQAVQFFTLRGEKGEGKAVG